MLSFFLAALLGVIFGFSLATIFYANEGDCRMKDYLYLVVALREQDSPLGSQAADALEALTAELHKANVIIQEQARENQRIRNKLKEARREN